MTTSSVPVRDPYRHTAAFEAAFNSGDLARIQDTLAPDAVFVVSPGEAVTGEEVTEAIAAFLAIGLPMRIKDRHVYVAGDIALIIADWSVSGRAADGTDVSLEGTSTDVIRRDDHGEWRSVIDNPTGTSKES